MNTKALTAVIGVLAITPPLQAADTGFLQGEAQEVIIKVRTADGKLKWYQVQPDGSRKELDMKPGDRFEFLYEDAVDLDAVTIKPGKN